MSFPRALVLTVVVLLATSAPATPQRATLAPHDVIVSVRRALDRPGIEAFLALGGGRLLEELPALGLLRVALPDAAGVEAAVARLARLPGVDHVEPNGWGEGGGFVVNDTFFAQQWHLDNRGQTGGTSGADIEAVRGWELARGSARVVVAVLDSGLAPSHPEFEGRVLPGRDFVNEDDDPQDDHGHGTLVTGILAANADNAFGLAGVDHGCLLLPVKILDRNNGGTSFDFAQGLVFAADAGADVINMSLINYPATQGLVAALQYARDAGCVLIACAGNGGIGDANQSFPGRSPLTISIGATTHLDRRAVFSGTGSRLDLVAPGDRVPATLREPFDSWTLFSGCSAATPVATGIAAVALSLEPALTHQEIRALLVAGAEDQVGPPASDPPGRDDQFGHGRVNLFRTLCGLDAGGPSILGPEELRIECPVPGGLAGDDALVSAALALVGVLDDLDPAPTLAHEAPAFLSLGQPLAVVFSARDRCGNESSRAIAVAVVDTRAPALELELGRGRLEATDGRLLAVGLQALASDACDPAPELELRVFGDEPSPRRRDLDAVLDRQGGLLLRAERDDAGDGRVYLCVVSARDDSGNASVGCATVVVPHGPDPAALEDVLRQAERAREECTRTGAPPGGFGLLLSAVLPKAPIALAGH